MLSALQRPKVLVIAGLTAVGKTEFAVDFAQSHGGEIICGDATQVYRHLDIGSAKPSAAQLAAVPHHLVGHVDPFTSVYTAGQFYHDAIQRTTEILARGRLPIIVGGSWLYIRFFVRGLPATPEPSAAVRRRAQARVAACNGDWQKAKLLLSDGAAGRLETNNWRCLTRYLEVELSTKNTLQQIPLKGGAPGTRLLQHPNYDVRCAFLYMPRDVFTMRARDRCERMLLDDGLLEEVKGLMVGGQFGARLPCARAVGYAEAADYLAHVARFSDSSVQKLRIFLEKFFSRTRQLGRSQWHLFRSEPSFLWLDAQSADLQGHVERLLSSSEQEYLSLLRDDAANKSLRSWHNGAASRQRFTQSIARLRLARGTKGELDLLKKATALAAELRSQCEEMHDESMSFSNTVQRERDF